MRFWLAFACALGGACAGTSDRAREDVTADASPAFVWALPDYVQPPPVPDENPLTQAKIALGRKLFHDPQLSYGGEHACARCHDPELAFSVAEPVHRGATGHETPRNAQGLANVAYAAYLTWSNLTFAGLEQQILNPLFGDNPVEMGAGMVQGDANHYSPRRLHEALAREPEYRKLFAEAFPHAGGEYDWDDAIAALASFNRSLISFSAPFDAFLRGDAQALTALQERGRMLFFSDRLRCGECHAGPLLSLAFPTDGSRPTHEEAFRNTGRYNIEAGAVVYFTGEQTRYPEPSIGIGEFSQSPDDDGKFRIPSLRNVALTAPYMHDGALATLDEVLDHYARGGTETPSGPRRGDGRDHPNKDPRINGFELSSEERAALLAFLEALTDQTFVERESEHAR